MENQEEIILEQKVFEILENVKKSMTAYKNSLVEIQFKSKNELSKEEEKLHLIGKDIIQKMSAKSSKIKELLSEIDIISNEIDEL